MAKKRKITARNRAFGRASRACLPEADTWTQFGKCMSRALGKGKGRRKKRK